MMPANSNCGGANHCNATGQCIGCTVAADCPGTDTACRTRTCTRGRRVRVLVRRARHQAGRPDGGRLQGPAVRRQRQRAGLQRQRRPARSTATSARPTSAARARRPTGRSPRAPPAAAAWSATAPPTASSACRRAPAPAPTPSATRAAASRASAASPTWPPGTLVAAQTPRDCKKNVCNGQGGVTTVNDDLDLPVDSNACTSGRLHRRDAERTRTSPPATAAAPTRSATARAPASPA